MQVVCDICGEKTEYQINQWHCDCGGAWRLTSLPSPETALIDKNEFSIWRYKNFIPSDVRSNLLTLGAGFTPLLPIANNGRSIWLKMDSLNPTGSFKDRGVELMMNYLSANGVKRIVEDSSGNAGASVSAYAARLGLKADIYAPSSASCAKLSQIEFYGANIHKIDGPRINATNAVLEAVTDEKVYASHAYNPVYLLGQQTVAYEIWEQLGFNIPELIVIPVGQGGNLLGYYLGFLQLLQSKLINKIPKLVAVQPQNFAPICKAFEENWQEWKKDRVYPKKSLADGLAIVQPVRWKLILKALQDSDGFCISVTENEIKSAHSRLAEQGFFVEPTSAVVFAGLKEIIKRSSSMDRIVLSLTGNGLKAKISA